MTPVDALFIATSAVCVTGLSVIDVSRETGVVSQLVLLSLIQIGGLGIMTGMMFMSLVVSRRVGIKGRIFFLGGFGVDGIQGAVKLFFTVIKFTFGLEAIGALIFIAGFLLDGESIGRAAYLAVFHSISSFCNAGFSPVPGRPSGICDDDYSSRRGDGAHHTGRHRLPRLRRGARGPLEGRDVQALGLREARRHHDSGARIRRRAAPAAFGLERRSARLSGMGEGMERPLHERDYEDGGLRHSHARHVLRARAGRHDCADAHRRVARLYRRRNKDDDLGVLAVAVWSELHGRGGSTFMGRSISPSTERRALSVVAVYLMTMLAGTVLLTFTEKMPYSALIFEAASALATTGLSVGITPDLSTPASSS